jgi:sulfotransferase family protein
MEPCNGESVITTEFAADPIIVYGAPRSGTTYLQQILNSHPDVFISRETRVFAWLYHALELLPEDKRLVVTKRAEFVEHLRSGLPQLIRDFYRQLAPQARFWGDKNPHYADERGNEGCLRMISEVFPGSRFIQIIRDGRDVVSSMVQRPGEGKPLLPFENAHTTWAKIVDHGSNVGRSLPSDRYFELRYEDLIMDDVAMADRIFRFLGLELHPAVVDFCRSQQTERTPFSCPTRNLKEGVGSSDWSRIFSPDDQRRSLELIGPQLVRYGYETDESLDALKRVISAPVKR